MGKFFGPGGAAEGDVMAKALLDFVQKVKASDRKIEKFGVMGYCWGAKVMLINLLSEDAY